MECRSASLYKNLLYENPYTWSTQSDYRHDRFLPNSCKHIIKWLGHIKTTSSQHYRHSEMSSLTYIWYMPSCLSTYLEKLVCVAMCVEGVFLLFFCFLRWFLPAQKPEEEILKHYHLEISYNRCSKKKPSTLSRTNLSLLLLIQLECLMTLPPHSVPLKQRSNMTNVTERGWGAPDCSSSLGERTSHQYKSPSPKASWSLKSFT